MTKKTAITILSVFAAASMLFGCGKGSSGGSSKSDTDTLTLEKNKVVLEEYSDDPGLSAEDVEGFVTEELSGVKGASLKDCSLGSDGLYLKTEYDDTKAYTAYTGYPLYYGDVLDGRIAGLSFGTTIYKIVNKEVGGEAYSVSDTDKFAAVSQEITVKVSGDIIAVSDPDAIVKKNTAFVHENEDGDPVYIIYK